MSGLVPATRPLLAQAEIQDSRSQRLYFVDIDQNNVYVYDPASDKYGVSHFDKNVTAIALLEDQDGVSYCYCPRDWLTSAHREHRGQLRIHSSLLATPSGAPPFADACQGSR